MRRKDHKIINRVGFQLVLRCARSKQRTEIYDDFARALRRDDAHLCADEDAVCCVQLPQPNGAVTSWSTQIANKNVGSESSRPLECYG